eukprot:TRINITY_DN9671_c0_g4_i1.p2 TRINITY_DN9671_c0_g4~~TRINITY_DN9671_c0_g4_i1.p2  ORF type:complete len:113 (+),score=24.52 TRINITY_DN9671_c0_g4_i1:421-759(+)
MKNGESFWAEHSGLREKLADWSQEQAVIDNRKTFERGLSNYYGCLKHTEKKVMGELCPEYLSSFRKIYEASEHKGRTQTTERRKSVIIKKSEQEIINGNYGIKDIMYSSWMN